MKDDFLKCTNKKITSKTTYTQILSYDTYEMQKKRLVALIALLCM